MFEDGLAELHTHLGASVASDILWSLAHEQGIALPVKDFWEFDQLVTVSDPQGVQDLNALDAIYHWTELIQSSPLAVERSVHAAIGGAYRSQGITTLELRFNPMKRNRGGERGPCLVRRERQLDGQGDHARKVMLGACSRRVSPSCTPTSAGRWPRRSSGASRTSRASLCP